MFGQEAMRGVVLMIDDDVDDYSGPDARKLVLDRLSSLYGEAMRSWERSKKPLIRTRTSRDPVTGTIYEQTTTTEERGGDPRFLSQAAQALSAIRTVLGLDAPNLSAQVITLAPASGNEAVALDIEPQPPVEIGAKAPALDAGASQP
jgi:hypothetical protein